MRAAVWEDICLALNDLESEMHMLGLWSAQVPTQAQLASTQPFCVDTLTFEQWLQWIFIPRMRLLADQGLPLPGTCQVAPMGEQALRQLGRRQSDLLALLARIDRMTDALGPVEG